MKFSPSNSSTIAAPLSPSYRPRARTVTLTPLNVDQLASSSDAIVELTHVDSDSQSAESYRTVQSSWDDTVNQDRRDLSRDQESPADLGTLRSRNGGEEEHGSIASSNFTESTSVPRQLKVLDVAALIFNKMVGSGIFTSPGIVLSLTKSKALALSLWAVGGVYTTLCLLIYLEFGIALPFTGGELIYLDEVFPAPEMLAATLFSGFFVLLANSAGNSIYFAKQVLLAANPEIETTSDLDKRLVNFIAITVLSFVCMLHYLSAELSLFLNRWLAAFKVGVLFACFVAGVIARLKTGPDESSNVDITVVQPGYNPSEGIAALVYVLYSYQGWENANLVAGEIRFSNDSPKRTLSIGAFLAVGVACLLYVLTTLGYYLACDYETITNGSSDLGMVIHFAPKAFGSSFGLEILIACSAFGNLIAVVYTSSKVKQAIAAQGIIPFHAFFGKNDPYFKTPRGALILHWAFSVIAIIAIPKSTQGYGFSTELFTYGHILVGVFMGIGFYRLRKSMKLRRTSSWKPSFLTSEPAGWTVATIFIGMNMVILVQGARSSSIIPGYWWFIVTILIYFSSFLYWGVLLLLQHPAVGKKIGLEVKIHKIGGSAEFQTEMKVAMDMAKCDGSWRRVQYTASGPTEWGVKKVVTVFESISRHAY